MATTNDLSVTVAEHGVKLTNIEDRIVNIEEKVDNIHRLTTSVEKIANDMTYIKSDVAEVKSSQKELKDNQESLKNKILEVENEPNKRKVSMLDNIWMSLVLLAAGGFVTYLLSQVFPAIFGK